ncbi:MAG: hypothetical protein J6U50_06810, partial [Lachnospiraceae bacterium]|nr:hypothetical protein [Lachnospiraceae bacterium]
NRYGHPHEETLARLEDANCAYLNTFETGAIFLDFSGEEIKLRTFSSHPQQTHARLFPFHLTLRQILSERSRIIATNG